MCVHTNVCLFIFVCVYVHVYTGMLSVLVVCCMATQSFRGPYVITQVVRVIRSSYCRVGRPATHVSCQIMGKQCSPCIHAAFQYTCVCVCVCVHTCACEGVANHRLWVWRRWAIVRGFSTEYQSFDQLTPSGWTTLTKL